MARKRQFDEAEVLDRAMETFWTLGYEGASIAELTKSMGINAQSLYDFFGNKRALFEKVLDRYQERRAPHRIRMLEGKTAREVTELCLFGAIDWLTDPAEPLGCLYVQCGLAVAPSNTEIPEMLALRRARIETVLTTRFQQGIEEGDLPPGTDAVALAEYVHTVLSGLSLLASAGKPADKLRVVAARAMQGWPGAE